MLLDYNAIDFCFRFCFLFQICSIFTATIPGEDREPLRIAVLNKWWKPSRIPTPRFIDAWTSNESTGSDVMLPVLLTTYCENIVVLRPGELDAKQRKDMFVVEGEISFARVYAKSGSGRDDKSSSVTGYPSSP